MVVKFAATSNSTHSTNRQNFSFKTNYVTGNNYLAKMDIISFFNRILEKLLTRNNGTCNQDLNSSKTQERKFFHTVSYSGKMSTTSKINRF